MIPIEKIHCTFELECDKRWKDLDKTENDKVRFCGRCQNNVHLVETKVEFESCAAQGKCVAVETMEYRTAGMPIGRVKTSMGKPKLPSDDD